MVKLKKRLSVFKVRSNYTYIQLNDSVQQIEITFLMSAFPVHVVQHLSYHTMKHKGLEHLVSEMSADVVHCFICHNRTLSVSNFEQLCTVTLFKTNIWNSNYILEMFISLHQQTPLDVAVSKSHDYRVECFVKKRANISFNDKAGVSMTIVVMID